MKRIIACFVFLALTQFNTAIRGQSNEGDAARQLAGMWRLVSNPQRLEDGTTRQGANSIGYAFFDAAGRHMCFLAMNPKRLTWKNDASPTPEEGLAALRGINSYCATIAINVRDGFMDRHYEISQNPNLVGKASRRWYSFQGANRMTLRVDAAELTKPVVETLFVWERVTK